LLRSTGIGKSFRHVNEKLATKYGKRIQSLYRYDYLNSSQEYSGFKGRRYSFSIERVDVRPNKQTLNYRKQQTRYRAPLAPDAPIRLSDRHRIGF